MSNEHSITIPLNRWIEEKLGPLESIPIHPDDATVIELVNPPHVHVQRVDIENGKKFSKPLLWNRKNWNKYEARILDVRKQSELRRSAANKYQHNIETVCLSYMRKFGFSKPLALEMASKTVMDNIGDPLFMREFLKADIQEQTTEEKVAVGEYYKKL